MDNGGFMTPSHTRFLQNGDLNWLVKGRILAFAGPSYERHISREGYCTLSPKEYIPYFNKKNVSLVVRLNKKAYHEEDFVEAGINHVEAFFLDGSCPPMRILQGVVEAFESVPQDEAFAVHCKAGLGRTGTCIGAYIMKHYGFTAREIIAWMRICRPGMVIGPQQHFLEKIQPLMWHEGEIMRNGVSRAVGEPKEEQEEVAEEEESSSPMSTTEDVPDNDDVMHDAVTGRSGQAEGLLAARSRRNVTATPTRSPKKAVPVTPEQGEAAAAASLVEARPAPQLWCG